MKFLKRSQLNSRNVKDNGVAIDINRQVIFNSPNSMLIPKGATADRPLSPTNGHMRYNTDTNQLESYQGGSWRNLRFKESGGITQQTLGPGDYVETTFGPLIPAPPATSASGTTWGGQNLIVLVENVFQISNTNYIIVQNPANITANIISFTAINKTISSSDSLTVDFVAKGFRPGQTINISGVTVNTGTYTVDTVSSIAMTVLESIQSEAQGGLLSIVGESSTGSPYAPGYYTVFGEAVPLGKYVTVLHGFDQ